jgi:large subunit ribosomal protein L3e
MSHRKFCAPRRGSLGFLPRGRSRHVRGRIRSWPKDNPAAAPHLTAFLGYKAGMTHVLRSVNRANSRLNKKDALEPVTVVEVPPLVGIGIVGYKETPQGLKPVTTAWAAKVGDEVKRRYYKNWYASKKKAFSKVTPEKSAERIKKLLQEATVVRLIAHTLPQSVKLGSKKAELIEIQVNGGSPPEKVKFAQNFFEKEIYISQVFAEGESVDLISVGKGRGWEGVVHRFGSKLLQKKTHRGRRKVGCIGPWNPMRILWTVARAGNNGFHHRTEMNKRIYRLFEKAPKKADGSLAEQATELFGGTVGNDLTKKEITPLGGFTRYGNVKNDFLLIKGSVCGATKRSITIRKVINPSQKRIATEELGLKWIDTASKFGHGRFQTKEERLKFVGKLKAQKAAASA